MTAARPASSDAKEDKGGSERGDNLFCEARRMRAFPRPAKRGERKKKGRRRRSETYSAGFGAAPAAAAFAAASAAALRSTKRTDQIEPSNSSISGTASESW